MKKFSKVIHQEIKEEPIEKKKELSNFDKLKYQIMDLIDCSLKIESYGSVNPTLKVPTFIEGKEILADSLVILFNSVKDDSKIKFLESLKGSFNDWKSIDNEIDKIKNEKIDINSVNYIKSFINKYGSDKDNILNSLLITESKITDKSLFSKRINACNLMIKNEMYKDDIEIIKTIKQFYQIKSSK